ncbi:MAG: AAA family ATPase [archaeon]|jgi:transitional endoplasmic reticulum ATPase
MNELKLKVKEALEEYVGKGIVSLSISTKQKLGILSGDCIEITGLRTTVAQVWPEKDSEENEDIIRMDPYSRENAGITIGDFVTIKKAETTPATQITIAPTKEINFISKNYDLIIKKSLAGRPFIKGDTIVINTFGVSCLFYVVSTNPSGVVILNEQTQFIVNEKPISKIPTPQIVGYEDIGGLKKEIEIIKEMVELPIKYPEYFKKINISPPKGILLYGSPGTGKTLLAKAISAELKTKFISVDAPQIMTKYMGEAEEKIRNIFATAEKNAPTVIFIDEIDAIAPKREGGQVSEVEKRVVAQLLSCMDGMGKRGEVIVIGATNRPTDIDMALRRPGRFDKEIEISIPNTDAREEILKIHTRGVPLASDVSLKAIAEVTHGFVGADLSALVKEAGISTIKNTIKHLKNPKDEIKLLENIKITKSDFDYALSVVQASALREVYVDTPDVNLEEVGALKEQKEIIKDIIELTLHKKEILQKMNLKIPKNLLLYGPPGTGKTMFVKGCAKYYGINFIYIKGPEVLNKWVGQSEKTIRDIFKKAREVSPVIVFFDEIDSITTEKNNSEYNHPRVLDQLLTELDNLSGDVIFIAATNRPDLIDKSVLRSGRIDKIIEFNIPSGEERKEIIEILLNKIPHNKLDIEDIVELTAGFSGADLNLLITDSTLMALKEKNYEYNKLSQKQILEVIKKIKPTVSRDQLSYYENFKTTNKIMSYIQ